MLVIKEDFIVKTKVNNIFVKRVYLRKLKKVIIESFFQEGFKISVYKAVSHNKKQKHCLIAVMLIELLLHFKINITNNL